jgi:putative nucleotidyltransferase with HDIG domain
MSIDKLKILFERQGSKKYGENVTQQEHAIQCYLRAAESNATLELRVAAFLHDVGHLLYAEIDVHQKMDFEHEIIGANFLYELKICDSVVDLIKSHVWAKRFLITQDSTYINHLSQASIDSFYLQGGKLTTEEFNVYSHFSNLQECLTLRRFDDEAKIEGLVSVIPEAVWLDIENCLN